MVKDWLLQITYIESVDSTQTYLKQLLREKKQKVPFAVVAKRQTAGVGSRDNSWDSLDGNLFLSFAINLKELPKDLKLESASIYFAYILKETLSELNSKVWLKWPNDFYIDSEKIGGMITNILGDSLVCGVGLNLVRQPDGFGSLDIKVDRDSLLQMYFQKIEKKVLWKQVFSKYQLEFDKNKHFFTHNKNLRISLEDVTLQEDGSIIHKNERIYSLR